MALGVSLGHTQAQCSRSACALMLVHRAWGSFEMSKRTTAGTALPPAICSWVILPAKKVGVYSESAAVSLSRGQSRQLPGIQADCDEHIVHHGIYVALQRDTQRRAHTREHMHLLCTLETHQSSRDLGKMSFTCSMQHHRQTMSGPHILGAQWYSNFDVVRDLQPPGLCAQQPCWIQTRHCVVCAQGLSSQEIYTTSCDGHALQSIVADHEYSSGSS